MTVPPDGTDKSLLSDPFDVTIVDGEIFMMSIAGASMTARAARETGRRLIDAANKLERGGI